jgi:hypothetical protein
VTFVLFARNQLSTHWGKVKWCGMLRWLFEKWSRKPHKVEYVFLMCQMWPMLQPSLFRQVIHQNPFPSFLPRCPVHKNMFMAPLINDREEEILNRNSIAFRETPGPPEQCTHSKYPVIDLRLCRDLRLLHFSAIV